MRLFRSLGLISVALGLFLTCGRSERREYSLKDELCPSNIEELVSLSADELERVYIGRMNLICAEAASGTGTLELPRLLRKLDEWAEAARRAEEKYRRTAYERQKGVCPKCGKSFALEAMQADHITPWSKGGRTVADNCQMLCADCNRRKSDV